MTAGLGHRERVVVRAAAWLLDYPGGGSDSGSGCGSGSEWWARLPLVRSALAAVGGRAARQLTGFVDRVAALPAGELAAHYVEVFDFKNRHSLYLTWWLDGDTRRRGASLVELKATYREAGLDFADTELPDFLPVVLEFTAATGDRALLLRHRPGLELLRLALAEHGTPYADVLGAVCSTLPGPSPKDRAAARALAAAGPATETVGLDPATAALRPYGHLDLLPVLTPDR
ncbi:nitrate reductase molybdenum cofactor assembly chaperone [Catenulispora yoronensis]|uniref:Nitrate reductase molybdenum cofactor assembly chaperone n=1 Tax=Catenulispora yoronensis TaxID=450799 RepID=A0ABP5GMX6_9ACTN